MPLLKVTTVLLFSFSFCLSIAQKNSIESLSERLSTTRDPYDSLRILSQLSISYEDTDIETGASITSMALDLSQRLSNDSLERVLQLKQATYHTLLSNFNDSDRVLRALLSSGRQMSSSTQLEIFVQIGKNFQLSGQHDSAVFYFEKAIVTGLTIAANEQVQLSRAYKSESLNRTGKLQEALDLCTKALTEIKSLKAKKEEAIILNFLGGINMSLGAMPAAVKHYLEALTIADSLQNERLKMEQLNDIGVIYAMQGENSESIGYFERALASAKKIKSHRDYIGALSNLAYMYSITDHEDQSIIYYEDALAYNDEFGDQCLHPFIYDGLARLYERLNQPDSVQKYFKLLLKEARSCQLVEFEIAALQGMGRFYKGQGMVTKSIDQFLESFEIAQMNTFNPLVKISADQLHQSYKDIGNYSQALKFHEIAEAMEDSIYSEKNKDEILRLTARYEFDKERQRISDEQERQKIQFEAELKGQMLTNNYMILGLFLTLVLIFTLWSSYESKKKSNIKLKRLNSEKNELIGVVAHDLRNPLNSILGFSQLMLDDLQDNTGSQHQYLSRINGSAGRMKHMIERVLDVNAIESEAINLDMKPVDLATLLDNVIESLKTSAEDKNITIICDYTSNSFFAEVDENYTIQVFENLISNAIKFSDSKKNVRISVMPAGERLKVLVEDHGPGIEEADRKLLFQRFTKLSARPTANETSTGLGLSIVKKYVDAMGGEIDVKSTSGVGSTFIVSFWKSTRWESVPSMI